MAEATKPKSKLVLTLQVPSIKLHRRVKRAQANKSITAHGDGSISKIIATPNKRDKTKTKT